MINYTPERIYEKIKDNETYKAVVAAIKAKKATCKSLEEWVNSDSESFYGDDWKKWKDELDSIVTTICPEYLVQYKTCNGEYTRDELLELYNSKKYDSECNLFFIANLSQEYSDGEYITYLNLFVAEYEKIADRDKLLLSKYIHMKYMYCKIYLYAYNTVLFPDKWNIDLFNKQYSVYTEVYDITKDKDNAANYLLEAFADSIQALNLNKIDMAALAPYMNLVWNLVYNMSFQYEAYSFGYGKIMDIRNMIWANNREFTNFLNGTLEMYKYLSNALANTSKLFAGLNYYDKCNHGMFVVLLRKYLKMKTYIPMLRTMDGATIINLSTADYQYALSDNISASAQSAEVDDAVQQYKKSVDHWFNGNNGAYNEVTKIK